MIFSSLFHFLYSAADSIWYQPVRCCQIHHGEQQNIWTHLPQQLGRFLWFKRLSQLKESLCSLWKRWLFWTHWLCCSSGKRFFKKKLQLMILSIYFSVDSFFVFVFVFVFVLFLFCFVLFCFVLFCFVLFCFVLFFLFIFHLSDFRIPNLEYCNRRMINSHEHCNCTGISVISIMRNLLRGDNCMLLAHRP